MSSPPTPDVAVARLQATALSARCHNALFRLKQLKSLHDTLRKNSSEIRTAIRRDTGVSESEATAEVAFALEVVKEHYAGLDWEKALEQEYRLANNKDADDERKPWGVVYIEPERTHTPVYSAIVALSAALVAGNCVALKLENTLREVPSLLRKLLTQALEPDTFAVVSSAPAQSLSSELLEVRQEGSDASPAYQQLLSPSGKVVAVVDRTAHIPLVAQQLVTARLAFGGTSPYAPDIVLVNEYVKKDLLEHVLKASLRFFASANGSTSNEKKPSKVSETLKSLSKSNKINIITQGDSGAVVEFQNLTYIPSKCTQPILAVASISSLEHALSLTDESISGHETFLAAYHFGAPSAGKYLSQFINADLTISNHVPFRLFLGPAAPAFAPIDIEKRYTADHFSRASPAYVLPRESQAAVRKVLAGDKESMKAATELLAQASQEIKEKKRKTSIAIGYFEQGIFIGLGIYGIPLLTCIGATLFFGVRAGLRRWVFA